VSRKKPSAIWPRINESLPEFIRLFDAKTQEYFLQRFNMDLHAITSQEILDRISRHCPGSLSTYLQVINRVNNAGEVQFTKKQIEFDMSETLTKFRNNLKKLALENLLEWHPVLDGLKVTLALDHEDE